MRLRVLLLGEEMLEELILPKVLENDTYAFTLDHASFGFEADVEVRLEEMGGFWTFSPSDDYDVRMRDEDFFQRPIEVGQLIHLVPSFRFAQKGAAGLLLYVCRAQEQLVASARYHLGSEVSTVVIAPASDGDADVALPDRPWLGHPRAVLKRQSRDSWAITSEAHGRSSGCEVYVNGLKLQGTQVLWYGDAIDVCEFRFVYLGEIFAISQTKDAQALECYLPTLDRRQIVHIAYVAPEGVGDVLFKRAPRMVIRRDTDEIEIEAAPSVNDGSRRSLIDAIGPSLTMTIPMLASTMLAGTGNPVGSVMMVVSSAGMAIWAAKGVRDQRKAVHEAEENRLTRYQAYLADREALIKEAYRRTQDNLLQDYPSAAECVSEGGLDRSLWNRNCFDDDYLFIRLGIGEREFEKPITVPERRFTLFDDELALEPERLRKKYHLLRDVPVGIDLSERVYGIIGGRWLEGCHQIIDVLVAQLTSAYSYNDCKVALICDERYGMDRQLVRAMRWFPHVWDDTHEFRYIGNDPQSVREVCARLSKIIDERRGGRRRDVLAGTVSQTRYVVLVTRPELIEDNMISAQLLGDDETDVAFTTFLCAEDFASLPNACRNVIHCTDGFCGTYRVTDDPESWNAVEFDEVSDDQLLAHARNIAPLRLQTPEKEAGVPDMLTFLQMFGASSIQDLHMGERWRNNTGFNTLAAEVGMSAGGILCTLDVHEKADGPHGLVAGTTGSGKSETLMTWIGSLSVNYSPDEVTFLLIDFKGGGLVNQFVNPQDRSDCLPHIVGIITNLSGNQIHRALVSINSENVRRQRMLTESGANDVYDYARLYRAGQVTEPMPHLMIVSDEFAELKKQYPDFMGELVSVAAIGRSLGVHLVLATQQPSGVVDDKISTNSRFRLCLKVQTEQDSKDMLARGDAAHITQKGRGYLRVGHDERLDLFQSAWSRAPYSAEGKIAAPTPSAIVSVTGQTVLRAPKQVPEKDLSNAPSQLDMVIRETQQTVATRGYRMPRLLWLPDLPAAITLDELDDTLDVPQRAPGGPNYSFCVPVGTYDDPARQYQGTVWMDFVEHGHYAVCGVSMTGKSVFLQTMLYSLMQRYSPDELNVYGVDYSNGMLLSLVGAPHVGGIVREGDMDAVEKLFFMLDRLIAERKEELSGSGFSTYKAMYPDRRLPAVVVAFDQYGIFRDKTESVFDDRVLRIAREAASLGIFFVITAAGESSSEIPTKLMEVLRGRLSLTLADTFAYREFLGVKFTEVLPTEGVVGRGLLRLGDEALEFQTAICMMPTDDITRNQKVARETERMSEAWQGDVAPAIPNVPAEPTLSEFLEHPHVQQMIQDRYSIPVGYDMRSAEPCCVRLDQIFCYLVSGKAKSGAMEFFCLFMRMAALKGAEIHVIGAGKTMIQRTAEEVGASYYPAGEDLLPFLATSFAGEFKRRNVRKHDLEMGGMDEGELFDAMADETDYFIFVEDLPAFVSLVYSPEGEERGYPAAFERFAARGWYHHLFLIGAVDQGKAGSANATPFYRLVIQDGAGMHFGGKSNEQAALRFDWLKSYSEGDKMLPPGVGMAATGEFSEGTGRVAIPDHRR